MIKLILSLILFTALSFAQGIGELAPDPEPIMFPEHSIGVDLMFGEGGFGLGGFYRKEISKNLTWFADLSISEAKDDKEIEYYDIFGRPVVFGKKNRIFLLPLNTGLQLRLFSEALTDNLRPYINFGVGPSLVYTTPFEKEFFSAFGSGQAHYTLGGYIGFGANFGLNQSSLIGINLRYYVIQFFNDGVEGIYNSYKKSLGGFYLTINIGSMY